MHLELAPQDTSILMWWSAKEKARYDLAGNVVGKECPAEALSFGPQSLANGGWSSATLEETQMALPASPSVCTRTETRGFSPQQLGNVAQDHSTAGTERTPASDAVTTPSPLCISGPAVVSITGDTLWP